MSNQHELVPGIRIGPYALGMRLEDARATRDDWEETHHDSTVVLEAGGWCLFADDDILTQVGSTPPLDVMGPYNLRLGSCLADVDGHIIVDGLDLVLTLMEDLMLTIDIDEPKTPRIPKASQIVWLGVHEYDSSAEESAKYYQVELT